jgi:hypothetical protein
MAFLFVALLACLLSASTYATASPVETVQSYFLAVNNGDYVAAAKLFKYPNYGTDKEYDDDVQAVSGDLEDLVADFGTVELLNQTNAVDGSYAGFGISAGTTEHVENNPPENVVHLRVRFSKIGLGYISFLFNSTSGTDDFMMVFYSVPKDKIQNTKT